MFAEENEISINSQGGTEITKRSIGKLIPEELSKEFQIIPSRVRELEEDKIRVYWAHDLYADPECAFLKDESKRNKFHKIVFSSNWQMNSFIDHLGIPMDDKLAVIETPLEPFDLIEKSQDTINLIYFSTPQRGLSLLVPTFKELAKKYLNIHLHVYSSFEIYGWAAADKPFEPLFEEMNNHSQMTYHGTVNREDIKKAIEESHILAYPCIWQETSCRVLMESMSAGLICVHPNLAALSDTGGGLTSMYQFLQDPNKHVNLFYHNLEHAINVVLNDNTKGYLNFVKQYADNRFNIGKVSQQWLNLMQNLQEQYPTVESRQFSKQEMLTFNTSI